MTTKTPNFELLKDAYAIIDGIPEEAFNLDAVVKEKGESLDCGTIACAAGWIGLHPTFAAKMRPCLVKHDGELGHFKWILKDGRTTHYYTDALAELFNIEHNEANSLFAGRDRSECDCALYRSCQAATTSDKELWKARVRQFLTKRGQAVNKVAV